ncbi:uncharacterized protein LOC141651370 [Silene latifolia]|uniref:uncharacterized protein LOC141651370 n=1 Tax=Silene latifolia TaxID=37657 RepID=UPI003D7722BB
MKMCFWNCAKAYNQADFGAALSDLREVDHKAAGAFLACNPTLFCRAFISTRSKTDVVVNNMAETFYAYIIEARYKHLLYMLEDIRTSIMTRLVSKKAEMEKLTVTVCPRVQARLEEAKKKSVEYSIFSSTTTLFQVKQGIDEVNVDLVARTCTCKRWDLTGIPYSHAVAAIFEIHGQPEDYVDDMYKKEAFLGAIMVQLPPCPSQRHWPKVEMTSTAHNKRRCPDKDRVVEPPAKRGRGRPRSINSQREEVATTSTQPHHALTAQPTRIRRGGRMIMAGRGTTRGRGAGRGTTRRRGSGRGRVNSSTYSLPSVFSIL